MSPKLYIAVWLNKYVRESWHYDSEDNVVVKGNITITDMVMEKLPVKFAQVSGHFKCKNCFHLKSVEGFPVDHEDIIIENCLLPASYYLTALHENKTLEEVLSENFDDVCADSALLETVKNDFPALYEQKKGYIAAKKFGF